MQKQGAISSTWQRDRFHVYTEERKSTVDHDEARVLGRDIVTLTWYLLHAMDN